LGTARKRYDTWVGVEVQGINWRIFALVWQVNKPIYPVTHAE